MQFCIIPGTAKTKGHWINSKNSETRLCFATTVMHKTLLIKTVLIKSLDERFKDAFLLLSNTVLLMLLITYQHNSSGFDTWWSWN